MEDPGLGFLFLLCLSLFVVLSGCMIFRCSRLEQWDSAGDQFPFTVTFLPSSVAIDESVLF